MNIATRATIWIGGFALLAATLVDTVAVIGRNVGLALQGSIELVQLFVMIAGAIALLLATTTGAHAKVHIVVDRLRENWRQPIVRSNTVLTALFFALLLAGSGWIAIELWSGPEESEIIGVPWRWMRLTANLCFGAIIVLLLRQAFGRGRS
jgi:TRAP-type transport system small permease protein